MRTTAIVAAALLWQAGDFGASHQNVTKADPLHMRYERDLTLENTAGGLTCVVLDAAAFAHAASRSADDLRVFRSNGSGPLVETPFALRESAAQPLELVNADLQNLGKRGTNLKFDLAMPNREYSEVDLLLDAKDFVGTATVSGSDGYGGPTTSLGSFAVFDLSSQHLSRSTALPLQESTFARLHVELHMTNPGGGEFQGLSPAIVTGATVPASREAQTLYTVVATSAEIHQRGSQSVATIELPAQVPIERVTFVLDSKFTRDFLRRVSIQAGSEDNLESEGGEISRVTRAGKSRDADINDTKLSVDAVLGANLRAPASATVNVENGNDAPLPIRRVEAEMRQRTVCFEVQPGNAYELQYGDVALRAPVYDFVRLYRGEPKAGMALLGEEKLNPNFEERADSRPYTERHPDILWIGLVVAVAALGATAMHSVKQQGKKG